MTSPAEISPGHQLCRELVRAIHLETGRAPDLGLILERVPAAQVAARAVVKYLFDDVHSGHVTINEFYGFEPKLDVSNPQT